MKSKFNRLVVEYTLRIKPIWKAFKSNSCTPYRGIMVPRMLVMMKNITKHDVQRANILKFLTMAIILETFGNALNDLVSSMRSLMNRMSSTPIADIEVEKRKILRMLKKLEIMPPKVGPIMPAIE